MCPSFVRVFLSCQSLSISLFLKFFSLSLSLFQSQSVSVHVLSLPLSFSPLKSLFLFWVFLSLFTLASLCQFFSHNFSILKVSNFPSLCISLTLTASLSLSHGISFSFIVSLIQSVFIFLSVSVSLSISLTKSVSVSIYLSLSLSLSCTHTHTVSLSLSLHPFFLSFSHCLYPSLRSFCLSECLFFPVFLSLYLFHSPFSYLSQIIYLLTFSLSQSLSVCISFPPHCVSY